MFERMILAAHDAGAELKVYLRHVQGTCFVGRVQDVTREGFMLFHQGRTVGNLWAFRFDDVSACALVTGLPIEEPLPCMAILTMHEEA